MNKILLAVLLLLLGASFAMADSEPTLPKQFVIVNTTDTVMGTVIPSTLIEPGKCVVTRIEAVTTVAGAESTETVAAIYDATRVDLAENVVLEGEIESNDSDSVVKEYPRGLPIRNGAVILQGGFTVVTVEWERLVP